MDASEGMLTKAKAKLSCVPPKTKLSFKQVVLPDMPYEDNLFDAAMINLVCMKFEAPLQTDNDRRYSLIIFLMCFVGFASFG
jgi:ubiquinone/menaquinone biosynthesis C-methylase UbiE